MSTTSRPYTDDDLPLLQAALGGWIAAAGDCGYCHVGEIPERIYDGFTGTPPASERVQVWEDDTGIAAFALTLRFDNAFELYTRPACRGTATERIMLHEVIAATQRLMQRAGRTETDVIIDVWDCDATRKRQLAHLGFEQYRVWGHLAERSLADPIPDATLPDGFTLRAATMGDYAALAAVRNAAFGTHLQPEAFRDEVMCKPGYEPERELVVVAPDGRFAAFTKTWSDNRNKVGLFEPVGTHPDFQRRGLGRAMMFYALRDLQRQDMRTAMVGYDAENDPAEMLYRRVGFRHKHTTLGYRR